MGHRLFAIGCLFALSSCGGTSSSETHNARDGGGAQGGNGGSSAAGGSGSGGGGTSNSGGSSAAGSGGSGAGGSAGCGPCPGVACGPAFQLLVQAEADAGSLDLADLRVQSPGIDVTCNRNGNSCLYFCQTVQYQIPTGHYQVAISARGFASRTIEFDAVAPTNCGCCGCCPFSFYQQVSLTPEGASAVICPQ